jgi:soluble lytic murein transglycosylase-like protein
MQTLINLSRTNDELRRADTLRGCVQKVLSGLQTWAVALVFVLTLFIPAYAAGSGTNDNPPESGPQPPAPADPVSNLPAPNVNDSVKTAEAARNNLAVLVKSYEQEAERLAAQNSQLKALHADGIISLREMEASDKTLAEARAKLEDAREQVKEAEVAIEAAKNPSATSSLSTGVFTAAKGTSPAWTTGNKKTDTLIRHYGSKHGVDPYLIFCVMRQESGFSAGVISPKGAQGLMQLMPATAKRFGVMNPYDPAQSIMGGTRYLKFLLERFDGRVDLTLAGYNAGEGAVQKYGNRIPPYAETQNYVRSIGARYAQGVGVQLAVKSYVKKS